MVDNRRLRRAIKFNANYRTEIKYGKAEASGRVVVYTGSSTRERERERTCAFTETRNAPGVNGIIIFFRYLFLASSSARFQSLAINSTEIRFNPRAVAAAPSPNGVRIGGHLLYLITTPLSIHSPSPLSSSPCFCRSPLRSRR